MCGLAKEIEACGEEDEITARVDFKKRIATRCCVGNEQIEHFCTEAYPEHEGQPEDFIQGGRGAHAWIYGTDWRLLQEEILLCFCCIISIISTLYTIYVDRFRILR